MQGSIKVDIESVKEFFPIIWDADKNGVLDPGDKLVTPNYEVHILTEEHKDPEVFARMLARLTGRITRIIKGPGLFSRNAYLAISYRDSPDIEKLYRIGNISGQENSDTPDVAINLAKTLPESCVKKQHRRETALKELMLNWFQDNWSSRLETAMALAVLEEYASCGNS